MKKFCVKQTMAVVCAGGLILAVNGRLFAADIDSADVLPEREAEIEASADADEAETTAETDVDVEAEAEWMSEINEAAEVEDIWTDDEVDAVSRATVAFKKVHFQKHVIKGALHTTGSGWAYATTRGGGGDVEVQVSITSPYGYATSGWYAPDITAGNVQGTSGLHGQHQARTGTAFTSFDTYH